MLEVKGLEARYGSTQALRTISLRLETDSVVALLGPNGAGKTTLLNAIAGDGSARPSGSIRFGGAELLGRSAAEILKTGIALCPEGRQLFGGLTVDENLLMGAYLRSDRDAVARDLEEMRLLFPRLGQRRRQFAATLSGGEQQMVALARALMSAPKLLLLDEPSLGLAPAVVREIVALIRKISQRGVGVLLVEQNVRQALRIAHRAYILNRGSIVNGGTASDLIMDESIYSAYLGGTKMELGQ